MCTMVVPDVCKGQNWESNVLQLEVRVVVRLHVGARIEPRCLRGKSSKFSESLRSLSLDPNVCPLKEVSFSNFRGLVCKTWDK